jgi:hypothetical protein
MASHVQASRFVRNGVRGAMLAGAVLSAAIVGARPVKALDPEQRYSFMPYRIECNEEPTKPLRQICNGLLFKLDRSNGDVTKFSATVITGPISEPALQRSIKIQSVTLQLGFGSGPFDLAMSPYQRLDDRQPNQGVVLPTTGVFWLSSTRTGDVRLCVNFYRVRANVWQHVCTASDMPLPDDSIGVGWP